MSLLTVALLKRSAREGMVVRSLASPPFIIYGTLLLSLTTAATLAGRPTLGLTPELAANAQLVAEIEEEEWPWVVTETPKESLYSGDVTLATDGHNIWSASSPYVDIRLEAVLRRHNGSTWRLHVPRDAESHQQSGFEQLIPQGGALLYALYAIVFGVGMITRDREDGTLDAERALAVPQWVHGAARWAAGAISLTGWIALNVALFGAIFPITAPLPMFLHGTAAVLAGLSLGLGAAAPSRANFSSALTVSLSMGSGLIGLGAGVPALAPHLPLASLLEQSGGWTALGISLLMGAAAVALSARTET